MASDLPCAVLQNCNVPAILSKKQLVGATATVYVSIPGQRSGRGKITCTAQGQYMEIDAMTDGERIPVDSLVEIREYNEDFAVVAKITADREENINQ